MPPSDPMAADRRAWAAAARRLLRIAHHVAMQGPRAVWRQRQELRRQLTLLKASGLFDAAWYLRTHPDVAASGIEPARHFLQFGIHEGRRGSLLFDDAAYLAAYPDVGGRGMHPLMHFLLFGREEGREYNPVPKPAALHIRAPVERVRSLALPFRVSGESYAPRIGVFMHLYYADLAEEFLEKLARLPGRADLFVTTTTEADRDVLEDVFARWQKGAVRVMLVPNRGRDIAPKLVTLARFHDDYDLCLHLHGKKSLHWQHGDEWRGQLLDCLIGDAAMMRSILAAFEADSRLGLVFPKVWAPIEGAITWGYEYQRAEALGRRLGVCITPDTPLEFAAGSMFWARPAALRPLLTCGLTLEDFPEEDGLPHGSLAHAIERLFLHVCEAAGYRWISVSRDDDGAGELIHIRDASELPAILDGRGYPLLVAPPQPQRPAADPIGLTGSDRGGSPSPR